MFILIVSTLSFLMEPLLLSLHVEHLESPRSQNVLGNLEGKLYNQSLAYLLFRTSVTMLYTSGLAFELTR